MINPRALIVLLLTITSRLQDASAFSLPMFQEQITMQRTAPSKTDGVEIELPDFDELFSRIQQVSPLSQVAISGETEKGGFSVAETCK